MTDDKGTKDPLEIKKKILADPNTAKIAATLGQDLQEYVEGVLHFVMNPDEKPELVVVTDEVAKERFGLTLPKEAEILAKFNAEYEMATIADKTDFTDPKAKPLAISTPEKPSTEQKVDSKLQEELKKSMRGKGGGV